MGPKCRAGRILGYVGHLLALSRSNSRSSSSSSVSLEKLSSPKGFQPAMSGGWLTVGVVGDNSTSGLWATGFLLQGGRSKKERKSKRERERRQEERMGHSNERDRGKHNVKRSLFSTVGCGFAFECKGTAQFMTVGLLAW